MPDFDNTNRGALFRNKEKEAETHPDYKGSINVAGTEFWLSAWIKESKAGQKFMSLSVKAKDDRQAPKAKPADEDSEIPF